MPMIGSYPPIQFSLFRVLLGGYLFYFFLSLVPFSADLFGSEGILPVGFTTPFPNILPLLHSTVSLKTFLFLLCLLSIAFLTGYRRRLCSLLLWYGYACLHNRLPYFSIPSEGYIGWLLLASSLIPEGEPFSLSRKPGGQEEWRLPQVLYWGAWLLLAIGYSWSGINKLSSPSWIDGSAVRHIFESPIAFDGSLKNHLQELPLPFFRAATWAALALEVLFLPVCLFRIGRKLAWFGMVYLHFFILMTLDIRSVSFGMLLAHLFVFDIRWLTDHRTPKA